jgi:glycine oxidase
MKRVIVIGAGIIGLSIAFNLRKKGFEMVLIDKGKAGMEASYAAAGMLAAQSEFDSYDSFMDICMSSRDMYERYCKDIEDLSEMDVMYQKCGMLRPALDEIQDKHFRDIYSWQRKKNFEIEYLGGDEIRKLEPFLSPNVISGLYIKNDALVNNRKLVESLIAVNKKIKNKIIENKGVKDYLIKNNKISGIRTGDNESFKADIVINTAGAWSSLISTGVIPGFEVKPIHGQMVSLQGHGKILDKVIYASILEKGSYIVPRENEVIIGSTMEDIGFKKYRSKDKTSYILEKAYSLIPKLKSYQIKDKWSGFRPYSNDQHPIIGKTNVNGLYLATAHGRNGILLAPITAMAIEELITNDIVIPEIKDYGVGRFSE